MWLSLPIKGSAAPQYLLPEAFDSLYPMMGLALRSFLNSHSEVRDITTLPSVNINIQMAAIVVEIELHFSASRSLPQAL